MIARLRRKGDTFWLVVPVAVILTIALVGGLLMGWITGAFAQDSEPDQKAIDPPKIVDVRNVPMSLAIDATIDKNDSGWGKRDEKKQFTLPPFPLSCSSNVVNPSYSATQGYNASTSVTLTINGYSAGLGAVAFRENVDKPGRCVGGNTYVTTSPIDDLGAEAVLVTASRNGISNQSVVWRRGDIISYLSAESGSPIELAKIIDRNLSSNIGGKCINEKSSPDDAVRTVWSQKFEGYKVAEEVKITKATLPKVPKDKEKEYEVTPIPSGKEAVIVVDVPDTPSHPVWPLMPDPVAAPKLPTPPPAEAPYSRTIQVVTEDVDGPGCGWDFTGTVRPAFDKTKAQMDNESLRGSTKIALQTESDKWKQSILAYWKATKEFSTQQVKYEAYSSRVGEVTLAWTGIQKEWDTYYANYAIYEQSVADNRAFLESQKAAQMEYDSQIKQCKAQEERKEREKNNPTPAPQPSPSPSSSPSETAVPTPVPTPEVAPAVETEPIEDIDCPPAKPDILSQEAPAVYDKPAEPANPIPESER